MRIAVASGKGGTGKTTVATNLAFAAASAGHIVAFVDCDVEEPNGHLFLTPVIEERAPVEMLVPRVDEESCTCCGLCGEICQFSAIVPVGQCVLTHPDLCHSCGGCSLVCPADAIREVPRRIGLVEKGRAGALHFAQGTLDIGRPAAPPVIRAVKAAASPAEAVILDAPPGTSCPVVEAVRECDFVLLVTDATPFGLHDLKLAVDVLDSLALPRGVVINRADLGDARVREYCGERSLRVLAELPDDRRVAEAYSRGELASRVLPEYEARFGELWRVIQTEVTAAEGARNA